MKSVSFLLGMCIVLLSRCSNEPEPATRSIATLSGVWSPVSLVLTSGREPDQIPGTTVFGFYKESIWLRPDGTYIAGLFSEEEGFRFPTEHKVGSFTLSEDGTQLLLRGAEWDMDWQITSFDDNQLILASDHYQVVRLERKSDE